MLEHLPELIALRDELKAEGYTDAVLLGMGGSSLGPEVIRLSFGDIAGALRLQVLDSTHPDAILAVEQSVDLAKTVFIVSSKSGGTIETLSHYHYFRAKAKPEQFIVVTDPGSPLAARAEADGLRKDVPEPERHRRPLLGALVLRAGAGRARRGARGRAAEERADGRADLLAPQRHRPTTRASGSAPRSASSRCAAATS